MTAHTIEHQRQSFLTRVLTINASVTMLGGAVLLLGANTLAPWLGLHLGLLVTLGAICLIVALALFALLATGRVTRPIVLALAIVEVAWVAVSIAALVAGWVTPTPAGWWAIVLQADVVAVFAALELYGLRRR